MNFDKRQCLRALLAIGFTFYQGHRNSPHDKYVVPDQYKRVNCSTFIMIPHGRNLFCQNAILQELKKLGGEELVQKFIEQL